MGIQQEQQQQQQVVFPQGFGPPGSNNMRHDQAEVLRLWAMQQPHLSMQMGPRLVATQGTLVSQGPAGMQAMQLSQGMGGVQAMQVGQGGGDVQAMQVQAMQVGQGVGVINHAGGHTLPHPGGSGV